MRKFVNLVLGLLLVTLLAIPSTIKAQTVNPQDLIGPEYPGTYLEMEPGDILYSNKNWSTFFVGHVAIVGPDYKVYHSHPSYPYRFAESLSDYISRHADGDLISVYKSRDFDGRAAAYWAQNNFNQILSYVWYNIDLNDVRYNYCSKFVWQAYWYGHGVDLTPRGLTDRSKDTIYPNQISNSSDLYFAGGFTK